MVTKDVQANLRKYKMGAGTGRTPSRGRRSASRGAGEGEMSPGGDTTVHFEDFTRSRSHGAGQSEPMVASRAIR
jgi:hypothetical protein